MSQLSLGGGGGAAITSINGDTTAAQLISGTAPITANTAAGTTTIASTAAAAGVAGHVTAAAQVLGDGAKTFPDAVLGPVITLTDGATVAIDAALGNYFELSTTQNPTLLAPSNPPGVGFTQFITIAIKATSAPRTPAFTTGSNDAFLLGTGLTTINAIASGTWDLFGFRYSRTLRRWQWVAWMPGFA